MHRRHYLKTLGATAGVVLTSVPSNTPARARGSPATEPPLPVRPIRFDRAVDMVADHGCDPGGREDCSDALRRAAGDDTVLVFQPGTYRLAEHVELQGLTNFGIRGEGRVTFEAPPDLNGDWLVVDRGDGLLFENVDLDVTAPNAAPTLQLGAVDGLVVRDVEVVGRGTRRDSRPAGEGGNVAVGDAFQPIVRSAGGTGVVENFVARHGGRIGTYNDGNGRAGVFIGRSNRGTIRLLDCHVAEFPNNGVYASRTHGEVQVVGGTFENNDISQVRLGSEGSFLSSADVRVDVESVSRPSRPSDFLNPRGVWIEGADLGAGDVVVRDTDVTVTNSTRHPPGAIEIERTGGRFHVANVRIHCRAGPAIIAKPPTGGRYPAPPEPHWGTIEHVTIGGSASEGSAIHLVDRPGSTIADATIDQPAGSRNGIRLVRSPGCTVSGCSIVAGQYPLLVADSGESGDADCLLALDGPTRLESRGADVPGSEATPLVRPTEWLLRGCLTRRMVTDDPGSNLLVAFTGERFGRLYGEVLSD